MEHRIGGAIVCYDCMKPLPCPCPAIAAPTPPRPAPRAEGLFELDRGELLHTFYAKGEAGEFLKHAQEAFGLYRDRGVSPRHLLLSEYDPARFFHLPGHWLLKSLL